MPVLGLAFAWPFIQVFPTPAISVLESPSCDVVFEELFVRHVHDGRHDGLYVGSSINECGDIF